MPPSAPKLCRRLGISILLLSLFGPIVGPYPYQASAQPIDQADDDFGTIGPAVDYTELSRENQQIVRRSVASEEETIVYTLGSNVKAPFERGTTHSSRFAMVVDYSGDRYLVTVQNSTWHGLVAVIGAILGFVLSLPVYYYGWKAKHTDTSPRKSIAGGILLFLVLSGPVFKLYGYAHIFL
jgi:hypothetical protein